MHFLSVICRMFQEQKKAKEKDDDKTKDGKKSKAEKADKGNADKEKVPKG